MSQKLSDLIRFTCDGFRPIKTKAQIRREASMKAARSRKRQKMALEAARAEAARQIDLEEAIAEAEKDAA